MVKVSFIGLYVKDPSMLELELRLTSTPESWLSGNITVTTFLKQFI